MGDAGHPVAQLREFDLKFAVVADCVLGEDVEDQLGAIDHAQIEPLREVSRLGRTDALIENHEVDTALERVDHEFLELARADDIARIDAIALLGDRVDDLYAGGARELDELGEVGLEFARRAPRRDRDQDGTLRVADLAGLIEAAELVFDVADPHPEIDIQIRGRRRCEQLDRLSTISDGAQRSDVSQFGQAVLVHRDRDHRVEA